MGGGGPNIPQAYNPQYQGQADQSYQSLWSNAQPWLQQEFGQIIPWLYKNAQGVQQNPYGNQMLQGALQGSQWGMGPGENIIQGGAQNLSALGNTLESQITPILSMANDPQGALYNRTLGQVNDQTAAALAQQGAGGSPYAADIMGQTGSDFNLAWQNNLLSRMAQGDQTAAQLGQGAQGAYGGAADLSQMATQLPGMAGAMPYTAYNAPYQTANQAWGQIPGDIASIFGPSSQLMGNLGQYLNIGQGATGLNQNAAQQSWQDQQQVWSGLGNLFGGMFGGFGPFGSMGAFSGIF